MAPPESDPGAFDAYSSDYDEALARGLSVSGESKLYFARERIAFLARCLRETGTRPLSALDYGCGTGTATPFLLDELGVERLVGVDSSERTLELARAQHGSARASFVSSAAFVPRAEFSLAYCNGVIHHVPPANRASVARRIFESVEPGGHFALWENNPWNPGARYVMWRIPFDRDAQMLSAREARTLLASAGFEIVRTDHLFIFPRALQALRFLEKHLTSTSIGAQYQVLARRPRAQGTGRSRDMREDASS
ncbi:MAG: class I SAM-dependent methyltransferase [Myxococcota bacterium]